MRFLFINGPNLDILGRREPEIYGSESLEEINSGIRETAGELGVEAEFFQSNHEGAIIDRINTAQEDGIIINPAGLTHTSVALKDSLEAFNGYVCEVHLSNIFAREEFRKSSVTASAADGVISGFGSRGYVMALEAAVSEVA